MPGCFCRWSLNGTPTHDWAKFMGTKRKELKRLNDIHSNMLDKVLCQTAVTLCKLCFFVLCMLSMRVAACMCYSSSGGLANFQCHESMQLHYQQQQVGFSYKAKTQHTQGMQHLCNVSQSNNVWHYLGTMHAMVVHVRRHQQLVPLVASWGHSSNNACTTGLHGGLCLTVSDADRLGSR